MKIIILLVLKEYCLKMKMILDSMSRSFGDNIAHTVGVTCETEIMEIEFNEEDKFIILDRDGIWEFISNQEVVEIIKIFI